MNLKTIKILAIISPIVCVVIFFVLGNTTSDKNPIVSNIGLFLFIISFLTFLASLIAFLIKRRSQPVEIAPKATKPAPAWYRLIKLGVGWLIIVLLYVAIPIYVGLVVLDQVGGGVEGMPAIGKIIFGYFAVLTQYFLPLPLGIAVWPITIISIGLIIFNKKYWKILDSLAIIFLLLIIVVVAKTLYEDSQKRAMISTSNAPPKIETICTNQRGLSASF